MDKNGRAKAAGVIDRLLAEAEAGPVAYPRQEQVPNWSDETLALFGQLTLIERSFAEWVVTGCNAAEAYRRAKGLEPEQMPTAKQNGYDIGCRPRVRVAIEAAMKDRNFNARCDLEWKLSKLRTAIAKCEEMESVQAQQTLAQLTRTMAELQGEIKKDDESGLDKRSSVHIRILEIVAQACGVQSGAAGGNLQAAVGPVAPAANAAVGAHQLPTSNGVAKRGR